MPRGVKGSGPQKDKAPAEVEAVEAQPLAESPDGQEEVEFPSEAEEQVEFDKGVEEFNNHIKDLVGLFFEKKVEGLEQRITDLEQVVGATMNQKAAARPLPTEELFGIEPAQIHVYEPSTGQVESYGQSNSAEEYSPAHQGGDGTPWYTG